MPTQKIVYIKREQKLFSSFASFCKEKTKKMEDDYLKDAKSIKRY